MSSASELSIRRQSRRRAIFCIGGLVVVGTLIIAIWSNRKADSDLAAELTHAEAALEQGDFSSAQRLVDKILHRAPSNPRALLLAGRCLDARGQPQAAVDVLTRIPDGQPPYSAAAMCLAGDILFLRLYRPSDAEPLYRRALENDSSYWQAHDRLAILRGVSGQWWRQIPARLATVRAERITQLHLFVLALGENALVNPELVASLKAHSPSDPLVLSAAARLAVEDEEYEQAIELLNRALDESPDLVQAHALLGRLLFEQGELSRFAEWSDHLPAEADDHPGVWVARGKWALERAGDASALRCFCEAVARDPNQPDALYQCGQILTSLDRTQDAAPFLERAKLLREFVNATFAADAGTDLAHMKRAATLAERLGNIWEAFGWASLAAADPNSPAWARDMASRLRGRLDDLPLERTIPEKNPATTFDFRSLPLPEIAETGLPIDVETSRSPTRFSFRDRTASAGISFQYVNGGDDASRGTKYMYEVMGGGVAVLDFNGDLLPDLYFAQGGAWPVDETRFEFLDRLYLNRGNGRFEDVTTPCKIRENRFSQGVAVGDVDSDGFPDLLVANIGRNRLYHNNGDGTFTDVSAAAGLGRSDWSTSCAIADLTGDGHPEMYAVNYLSGADVFTRTCGPANDNVCVPQQFPAAQDRLHWNPGGWSFRDVTETSGVNVDNGKGLGILVGLFGASKAPNLFVANDTVANFYFENLGPDPTGAPRFAENALPAGLAMDESGRTEACMGVAAGDADGDGTIDLFVTNFFGESNTLYRCLSETMFTDVTLRRGLHQPGLHKLGFGTQFLDADLDGKLDLIVANGHIDNFSDDGRTTYQMRPQFFENRGDEGFREVDSEALGPWFTRKFLGRALARLDWNRDGKEDAVVSHLDAPTALLENTTRTSGTFLALHLRGVASNRDAIGAIVEVETRSGTLTRQLTAGDGFQASNERILVFGLGEAPVVERMTVDWPSGRREEFTDISPNTRWILVEGTESLVSAPVE